MPDLPEPVAIVASGLPKAASKRNGTGKRDQVAAPVTKYVMKRINLMGSPMGRGEEEDGPDLMPRARKIELCHKANEAIDRKVKAQHAEWYAAGRPMAKPPYISTASGGTEAGEKRGKIHVQDTFEVCAVSR